MTATFAEEQVLSAILTQLVALDLRGIKPVFIILGANKYLLIKGSVAKGTGFWPKSYKGCTLVVDPADKNRMPLVVADPVQEILMKIREEAK